MFFMGHKVLPPLIMTICFVSKKQPWLKSCMDFFEKLLKLKSSVLGEYYEIVLMDFNIFIEPLSQSVTRSCSTLRVLMLFGFFLSLDICSTKFL
jgi:hypothetical protein